MKKQLVFRMICLLLLLTTIWNLASCGQQNEQATQEETEEESMTEIETEKVTETEPVVEPTVPALALSVTEGGVKNDRASIRSRFKSYKAAGITCVRIDTAWSSPSEGKWTMSDTTRNYLAAAREYGITLKLILPTVMAPPAWLSSKPGARLVDWNGRQSVNTVSYWYNGLYEYTQSAVNAQVKAIVSAGYKDVIGAVIVDMGPAGEPLYPPAWTQVSNGLDSADNGEDVMWCYADNAQTDFRAKMKEKYGTIEAANQAWGTSYASFDAIKVPKVGEAKGELWRDVLTWYRDTKRAFMDHQVDAFKKAMKANNLESIPLILYLPGADYTNAQWEDCIKNGTAIAQIRIGGDNQYTADLAKKHGCSLQYTGINDEASLYLLRSYMYDHNYESVPVYGENAGDPVSAGSPTKLGNIVMSNYLSGIDYTHCRFLFESDGVTTNDKYTEIKTVIATLKDFYLKTNVLLGPPKNNDSTHGNVIRVDYTFNKPADQKLAYIFTTIATIPGGFVIEEGDTLEYDLFMEERFQGVGGLDGTTANKLTLRDNGVVDTKGVRCHPNANLSMYCFKKGESQWYHRVLNLDTAKLTGQTLSEIMIAAHPEDQDGPFTTKEVTIYYDNIVLKRDGEVVLEIFSEDEDTLTIKKATNVKYAQAEISIEEFKQP